VLSVQSNEKLAEDSGSHFQHEKVPIYLYQTRPTSIEAERV
jgi:hypothetical protein